MYLEEKNPIPVPEALGITLRRPVDDRDNEVKPPDPQWLVVAQQAVEGAYDREMPDLLRTILEACWANPTKLTTQAGWRIERILFDRGEKLPIPPTQTLGEMMECYSAPPPWLVAKTVLDGDFDDDHPISLRETVEMMGDDQYPDCIAARQRIDGLLRKAE
jgi:hypothetical protein